MPCDSIQTVGVKWDVKSTDLTLLTAALNALGMSAQLYGQRIVFNGGQFENGKFTYESTYYARVSQQEAEKRVAQVKRAYSAEVVKSQAKRYGWTLKEVAPYEYEVMKR